MSDERTGGVDDLQPEHGDDADLVRRALRDAVADIDAPPELLRSITRTSRSTAIPRWIAAVAAVAVVGLLAAGVMFARRDRDSGVRVQTPPTTTTPTPASTPTSTSTSTSTTEPGDSPLAIAKGRWTDIGDMPLSPRRATTAATVWTGTEVLVWGNGGFEGPSPDNEAGAAFDPTTGTWRKMAAAPGSATNTAAIWTGTDMVVSPLTLADGTSVAAAYDPAADSWRTIATVDTAATPVAWFDDAIVMTTGSYGAVEVFLLNPATGARTPLPAVPATGDLNGRPSGVLQAVVVDGDLYARSSLQSSTATLSRLDRTTDTWHPIGSPPDPEMPIDQRLVAADDTLLVLARAVDGTEVAYRYQSSEDRWETMPTGPGSEADAAGNVPSWAAQVEGAPMVLGSLVWSGGGILDVATGEWTRAPEPRGNRTDTLQVTTDEAFVFLGGAEACVYVEGTCTIDGGSFREVAYRDGWSFTPA